MMVEKEKDSEPETIPEKAPQEEDLTKLTIDEKFERLGWALTKCTLPELNPRRDVIFVVFADKMSIVYSRRDAFLERFGDELKKGGWYEQIRDLLESIPRAAEYGSGVLLPAMIGVENELRLAWLVTRMPETGSIRVPGR